MKVLTVVSLLVLSSLALVGEINIVHDMILMLILLLRSSFLKLDLSLITQLI